MALCSQVSFLSLPATLPSLDQCISHCRIQTNVLEAPIGIGFSLSRIPGDSSVYCFCSDDLKRFNYVSADIPSFPCTAKCGNTYQGQLCGSIDPVALGAGSVSFATLGGEDVPPPEVTSTTTTTTAVALPTYTIVPNPTLPCAEAEILRNPRSFPTLTECVAFCRRIGEFSPFTPITVGFTRSRLPGDDTVYCLCPTQRTGFVNFIQRSPPEFTCDRECGTGYTGVNCGSISPIPVVPLRRRQSKPELGSFFFDTFPKFATVTSTTEPPTTTTTTTTEPTTSTTTTIHDDDHIGSDNDDRGSNEHNHYNYLNRAHHDIFHLHLQLHGDHFHDHNDRIVGHLHVDVYHLSLNGHVIHGYDHIHLKHRRGTTPDPAYRRAATSRRSSSGRASPPGRTSSSRTGTTRRPASGPPRSTGPGSLGGPRAAPDHSRVGSSAVVCSHAAGVLELKLLCRILVILLGIFHLLPITSDSPQSIGANSNGAGGGAGDTPSSPPSAPTTVSPGTSASTNPGSSPANIPLILGTTGGAIAAAAAAVALYLAMRPRNKKDNTQTGAPNPAVSAPSALGGGSSATPPHGPPSFPHFGPGTAPGPSALPGSNAMVRPGGTGGGPTPNSGGRPAPQPGTSHGGGGGATSHTPLSAPPAGASGTFVNAAPAGTSGVVGPAVGAGGAAAGGAAGGAAATSGSGAPGMGAAVDTAAAQVQRGFEPKGPRKGLNRRRSEDEEEQRRGAAEAREAALSAYAVGASATTPAGYGYGEGYEYREANGYYGAGASAETPGRSTFFSGADDGFGGSEYQEKRYLSAAEEKKGLFGGR
ncbi:hypothetical protein HDU96_005747 [Phlyctochytrium bullatum]|nr:hypothetical protein HDU96_005747 [Phlyctochytrium bullatum]